MYIYIYIYIHIGLTRNVWFWTQGAAVFAYRASFANLLTRSVSHCTTVERQLYCIYMNTSDIYYVLK